jgi:hypothetical protein
MTLAERRLLADAAMAAARLCFAVMTADAVARLFPICTESKLMDAVRNPLAVRAHAS